jgi:hypothetical protein
MVPRKKGKKGKKKRIMKERDVYNSGKGLLL